TGGPPGLSSSALKNRPIAGRAPSTAKRLAVVTRACADTGSPPIGAIAARPSLNAAIASNDRAPSCQCRKLDGPTPPVGQIALPGFAILFSQSATMRSACGYGSPRSSTALTTEKIAVVAPTESASVATAAAVNAGAFRKLRIA